MSVTIEAVDNELNKKLKENNKLIIYTYYELRVKNDLSKIEANTFLELTKTKLENIGYRVYKTGETYIYEGHAIIVKDNELLLAIKI